MTKSVSPKKIKVLYNHLIIFLKQIQSWWSFSYLATLLISQVFARFSLYTCNVTINPKTHFFVCACLSVCGHFGFNITFLANSRPSRSEREHHLLSLVIASKSCISWGHYHSFLRSWRLLNTQNGKTKQKKNTFLCFFMDVTECEWHFMHCYLPSTRCSTHFPNINREATEQRNRAGE